MLKSIAKAAAKVRRDRIAKGQKPSIVPDTVVDPSTGEVFHNSVFSARIDTTENLDRFNYDAAADDEQYTPFDHRLV